MAMCSGTCHGKCSAAVSPPHCTGKLDCAVDCQASCKGQVAATVDCPPPHAVVTIEGDEKLYAAFTAHLADIGAAINLTIALKDPIGELAAKGVATFQALGDIGANGVICATGAVSASAKASASINVSVSASATVSGKSS
jgi:hypothetical protein